MNNKQKSTNKSRARSRNFPVCSLEQAVDNVRILKNKEGINPTPKNIAVKYWNLSPTSGTGIRMLSALIQFGLLEEEGRGNERRVYPSALANEILENPDKNQRIKASQEAALKPSLFQETWSRYKSNYHQMKLCGGS